MINAKEWLETHNIEIDHEKPLDSGGICYVLKTCPWNSEHTDKSACVIQLPNGIITAKCHHDSCSEENWASLQRVYSQSLNAGGQEEVCDTGDASSTELILAQIKSKGHVFFHDNTRTGYVKIPGGYTQYLPIHSKEYALLLQYYYFNQFWKTINKDILKQVQDTLEAEAVYNGENKEVYVRCGFSKNVIYYYLADKEESVIAIDENGYHVCNKSPIPFIRKANMLEQAMPENGTVSLRKITNQHWKFESKQDKMLHDILLVSRFIPPIPTPIVLYMGTRGSAKTTSMSQDKMITDPNAVNVKALPRNSRDIVTSLTSQYMACFDNIDKISSEVSDLFCIASTGGHYPTRKLYTDSDECNIKLNTRLNVTSINMPTNRPDLYDRTIVLTLKRLRESDRKTLEEVMERFQKDIPFLLGAIFCALSKAMRIKRDLKIDKLPRMADFALWGYSIAEALSYGGERFLEAYNNNQKDLTCKLIEEDSVATTIISYCQKNEFCGSMSDLLVQLTRYAETQGRDTHHGWISSPGKLSHRLNELETLLAEFGIYFERKKSGGNRIIKLYQV